MRLIENRAWCDTLHEDLIRDDPWGRGDEGKFVVRLILSNCGEDKGVCSVYEVDAKRLTDFLLGGYFDGETEGILDDEAAAEARIMISDMEDMIADLKAALPESEGK